MYKYVILNGDVYIKTEPRVQITRRVRGLVSFVKAFVGKVRSHV